MARLQRTGIPARPMQHLYSTSPSSNSSQTVAWAACQATCACDTFKKPELLQRAHAQVGAEQRLRWLLTPLHKLPERHRLPSGRLRARVQTAMQGLSAL